ncbi:MAG: GNAT family N-acetyltransferase [Bacteroidetes bacterium]|nr:GNAT family N-acetyltransferase [Bacteroidota bacterium]MBS1608553.1 GNAT family N-acetyltransferase [Bacteroidota bacterium]
MHWQKDDYTISTDQSKLDIKVVHDYLSNESYWAEKIPMDIVKSSIENSLCFGLYYKNIQVGFARVVSDFATFAYLGDVFVLPEHRGRGLSKWMMTLIMNYPQLQGLRRFLLTTKDAHSLYAQFGFVPYPQPERLMAINRPDIYKDKK